MNNLQIALCDQCEDYIIKLASYLMEKANASFHIFTSTEGFFTDENNYDIALLSEEFADVGNFKPKGMIKHKYYLTEDQEDKTEDGIYKYQSVDNIFDQIKELKSTYAKTKSNDGMSKLVGVYSPAAHELQLPFSMALTQIYGTNKKVLFLDLEEISILPNLIGSSCERNLMDYLYELSTGQEEIDLSKYVKSYLGFDYIEPFINPTEIGEIDEETWSRFFDVLSTAGYDIVVVLFGRAINGFNKYIQRLDKLFVLGKPGDYFRKSQELFLDYMERSNTDIELHNVLLPMSAGNLSDGAYQLEELLQGNLGVFVRKLLQENMVENYG